LQAQQYKSSFNTLIYQITQVFISRAPFGGQGADSRICGNKQYYYFFQKSGKSHKSLKDKTDIPNKFYKKRSLF